MALSELDMMNLWAKQLTGYKSQWERLFGFGYAVEAEVREQDDALIQQLVEALCECAEDSQEQLDRMEAARLRDYKPNAIAWQEDTIAKAKAAIVAGRARLEGKP